MTKVIIPQSLDGFEEACAEQADHWYVAGVLASFLGVRL